MRNLIALFSSYYFSYFVAFVASLYVKRITGPEFSGALSLALLFAAYCGNAYDVLLSALDREVPAARGKGDSVLASNLHIQMFWLLVGFVALTTLVYLSCVGLYWKNSLMRWAFIVATVTNVIAALTGYIKVFFRVEGEIIRGCLYIALVGVIPPISRMMGAALNGIEGLAVGALVGLVLVLVASISGFLRRPFVKPRWDIIWRFIRFGVPVNMFFLLLINLESIDRYIILKYRTLTDLGFYSFAILALTVLSVLPMTISLNLFTPTWYRTMAEGKTREAYKMAYRATLVPLWAASFAILTAILVAPTGIAFLLPAFVPATRTFQILALSAYWAFLYRPLLYLLIARERFLTLLGLGGFAVLLYFCCTSFGIHYGLPGMACGVLYMFSIFANISFITCGRILGLSWMEITKRIIELNVMGQVLCIGFFLASARIPLVVLVGLGGILFHKRILATIQQYLHDARSVRQIS